MISIKTQLFFFLFICLGDETMEEIKDEETVELANVVPEPMDSLWALMMIALLFWQPAKPDKVINIYMGDE